MDQQTITRLIAPFLAAARRLKAFSEQHRTALLTLAFAGFALGTVISVRQLQFDPARIDLASLAVLIVIIVPAAVAYSATNLMVMARASGADMAFAPAFKTSVFAGLAELLPLPGGAIVRSAALTHAGAKVGQSVELVLAFALLWIAVSASAGAIALTAVAPLAGIAAAIGAAVSLALTAWIAARYDVRTALAAFALRLLGVVLTAFRLGIALMALSIVFDWSDTLVFTFAVVTGSASTIVPAGLGVSEALAALFASALAVSPAEAFLAVALSRLAGIVVNSLFASLISLIALSKQRMNPSLHD